MNPEEEIFETATELPDTERAAYLDEACHGQPELRARIEALLRADEVTGFMEDRTVALPGPPVEQSGERIGRYKLLQQIGEGGFGTVWMAEQVEPVTRRVALKIIKAGMDTREVIARFEAERQALAMMDHPNIARVLDAGATDKGRPFFVMELVKGIPITRFCDEQQFTTRQRLELFGDVCSAINHAHQKGVIHRDIKPSNVMVTLNADRPVVKVIDFGIAKATQGKLTDHTLFTRFEQFIGTPAYMSPEQAAISGVDIDTRSDIYSLGVLLYELLTGQPPFDAKSLLSSGYEEMRRIIREVEPSKPSTRVKEMITASTADGSADESAVISHKSKIEPDLDWIVMKAIEKDRARRYETANGLALDIRRYLLDEPVSAGPPAAAYRFRKFARRHRGALRTAAAVAAVMIAATAVSVIQAIKATRAETRANRKAADEAAAREEADRARRDAEAMTACLTSIFRSPTPWQDGRSITLAETLENAVRRLDTELADQPAQRVKLQSTIAWSLRSLGMNRAGIPLAEKGRDYYLSTFGRDHPETLGAMHGLALFYLTEGRNQEAFEIMEEVVALERKTLPANHPELLQAMGNLGLCYVALNRLEDARRIREEALSQSLTRGSESLEAASAKAGLADSHQRAWRHKEAQNLLEEALAIRRKRLRAGHPDTLFLISRLAESFESSGRSEEALALRRELKKYEVIEADEKYEATGGDYKRATQRIAAELDARRFAEAVRISRELVQAQQPPPAPVAPSLVERVGNALSSGSSQQVANALQQPKVPRPSSSEAAPEAWLAVSLILLSSEAGKDARENEAGQAAGEADALLRDLLSRPGSSGVNAATVDLFSRYGHWKQAAELARKYYQQSPGNPWPVYRLAPLLLDTGDTRGFEKLRQEVAERLAACPAEKLPALLDTMVKQYGAHAPNIFARTLCFQPGNVDHSKWAMILSERALEEKTDRYHNDYFVTLSLVEYRSGNYQRAVALLQPVINFLTTPGEVSARAILSLANSAIKDGEAAQREWEAGSRLFTANWFSGTRIELEGNPHSWLVAKLLLAEAEAKLRSNP
jgi:tetratricopeptide (TPR) repeat protein